MVVVAVIVEATVAETVELNVDAVSCWFVPAVVEEGMIDVDDLVWPGMIDVVDVEEPPKFTTTLPSRTFISAALIFCTERRNDPAPKDWSTLEEIEASISPMFSRASFLATYAPVTVTDAGASAST